MSAVISTGAHPKALWPGINEWWGRSYESHGEQCRELFDFRNSGMAYEEDVEATGFGLAGVKSEGQAINFVSEQQGTVTRYQHIAYALGYVVTREELDDNLYETVSMRRAEANAFSMRTTRETVAANIYNRAFDSNYTFGDGKEILATDHPSLSGNQSNELATAADLSESSLEDLIIQIMNVQNSKGLRIGLTPRCIVVAPGNWFNANRILSSALQNDTANNANNVLRQTGALPEGIKVNNYLTDADAWFVRTNAPAGMKLFDRVPIEFSQDNDFDTQNAKAASYMRFSVGVSDWRSLFGSPGA